MTIAPPEWKPPSSVIHRRSVTEALGGWRNYREMKITPEGELWRRVHAAGYRIDFLPRLTAIKFPAGWRRNVYKTRPSDEQAAWLERIRTEPDLEVVELAKIACRYNPPFVDRLLRLLSSPSQWLSVLWRRPGVRMKAWQRYKGVLHAPRDKETWHADRSREGPADRHE